MPQINVLHPGDPIQNQDSNAGRKRSSFDLSSVLYNTSRFGEISAHFVTNAIPADHFSMKCKRDCHSLSLKAPFLGTINQHQDYFFVPMSCLLPRNCELIQTQPNIGDDVPSQCYTNIEGFKTRFAAAWETPNVGINAKFVLGPYTTAQGGGAMQGDMSNAYKFLMSQLFTVEALCSEGSLLNELGCNMSRELIVWDKSTNPSSADPAQTIDSWFEHWLNDPEDGLFSHCTMLRTTDTDAPYTQRVFYKDPPTISDLNFRDFVDFVRENGITQVQALDFVGSTSYPTLQDYYDHLYDYFDSSTAWSLEKNSALLDDSADVDLARLLSYQMVCAHFYTNDSVDFVYSAELYRDNILALIRKYAAPFNPTTFVWNGIDKDFDVFSEAVLGSNSTGFLYDQAIQAASLNEFSKMTALIMALFSRRHSLRYVDAVTGLRTRPLAVGTTTVSVSGSSVDVVDITRGILIQRFLNHVNRTGRKLSNYIKGLFGTEPSRDICDPLFLAATTSTIFTADTQNTGSDQLTEANSVTSKFVDESASHGFEFDVHDYGVLLGITYYDVRRPYVGTTDPLIHVRDRYDLFNPFIEDSGDQGFRANDISDDDRSSGLFGYQQRYSEYKQVLDRAIGGFAQFLPGFALPYKGLYFGSQINPDNIRSWNRELDPLFVTLNGYGLAQYFHFYHKTTLDVFASRAMSANAKIL